MNGAGPEGDFEIRLKIPAGSGAATEYIQTQCAVLRERVTGDVRFLQQTEASETAGVGKLVPRRVANRMEVHAFYKRSEEVAEARRVG